MEIQIKEKPFVLTYIGKETPDVNSFRFTPKDGIMPVFDPGMFVMLEYVNSETSEKISRAYSIASSPKDPYLEFFITMIHGRFTSHLDTAKIGDIYYVTGPYGQFRFTPGIDKKVLFLAGGTGIAPFMSMLKYIRHLSYKDDIVLIYSVRYPNEIIRKDELEQLEKDLNMKLIVTVTRPSPGDGWAGETGHINPDMIKRHAQDFAERTVYICGPLGFVNAMKDSCNALGIDKQKVRADVWG
ncbi:MAG: ferredoxin--NADP reductase [Candidatus Micrarchaeia archaeon]